MLVLITYDIKTDSSAGRRRLRNIAKTCLDFGQRVQYSVFECDISPARWAELRARLVNLIDPGTDSLRFYMLGSNWRRRIEHIGAKPATDFDAPLIF
jgi:CRISPR-associated protein Cas2